MFRRKSSSSRTSLSSRESTGNVNAGSSQVQPPPPPGQVAPGWQRIGVKVPQGMSPGDEIQFPTPQGMKYKAVIPPGITSGNVFLVEVPVAMPGSSREYESAASWERGGAAPQPSATSPGGNAGNRFYPPFSPHSLYPPNGDGLPRRPSSRVEEDADLQRALEASRQLQQAQQEEEELARVLAESAALSAASENGAREQQPAQQTREATGAGPHQPNGAAPAPAAEAGFPSSLYPSDGRPTCACGGAAAAGGVAVATAEAVLEPDASIPMAQLLGSGGGTQTHAECSICFDDLCDKARHAPPNPRDGADHNRKAQTAIG